MKIIAKKNQLDLGDLKKHLALIMFLLLAYVSFLIIKPYLLAFIMGAILSFIFYPLYIYLKKVIKKKTISALLVTLFILLVFIIPLSLRSLIT